MDQVSEAGSQKRSNRLITLVIALGASALLGFVLGWLNDTTELTPNHEGVLKTCFVLGSLSGLASAVVAIHESKEMAGWRRASVAFVFALLGLVSAFVTSSNAASMVEGLIDFPSGKTTSYPALLVIARAYRTHGKGEHRSIQTTPIWSNLDITEDDYDFMLAHRRPGEDAGNADEISSRGYFCAKVTLEQAGSALRVMHAGSHELPRGVVVFCQSR